MWPASRIEPSRAYGRLLADLVKATAVEQTVAGEDGLAPVFMSMKQPVP